jgi:hypothetical protein
VDSKTKSEHWQTAFHAVIDQIAPSGLDAESIARRTAIFGALLANKLVEAGQITNEELDEVLAMTRR